MIVRFEDVITRVTGNVDRYNTDLEYYVGGDQYDSSALTIERRGDLKKDVDILGFKFHFPFKRGDVLLMARNPHLRKAGQVFFDGLCSDASYILRTKNPDVLLQDFIPILLQRDHFWDFFESHKTGGITFLMNWGMLKTYEFGLPPIEKQREVMEQVWAAYRLKQSYQKLIEATDEMVKSRFIEMFGPQTVQQKDYPIKKLGGLAECYAGATPSTAKSEYWENGTIPWMSSGEVHLVHVDRTEAKITQTGYDHASTKMVPIHSVVIALAGQGKTRGTVAITEIPLCTNQSLCAIVPGNELHYEYLFHNLNGRYLELRGMAGDVNGRGGLNLRIIQSIPIVVPPMKDQLDFVEIAQQADKSKFELKQAIEKIDKVMRALMQ
jgi:type I restriction enzyme S subunit